MTQTQTKKPNNQARVMRATILGILAGYAILLAILFAFHEAPSALLDDIEPFLIVGGLGLAFSIGPILWPSAQEKLSLSGKGLWKSCANQSLTPQRAIGLAAMGFMFGALLSQTVKLFVG